MLLHILTLVSSVFACLFQSYLVKVPNRDKNAVSWPTIVGGTKNVGHGVKNLKISKLLNYPCQIKALEPCTILIAHLK